MLAHGSAVGTGVCVGVNVGVGVKVGVGVGIGVKVKVGVGVGIGGICALVRLVQKINGPIKTSVMQAKKRLMRINCDFVLVHMDTKDLLVTTKKGIGTGEDQKPSFFKKLGF